MTGANDNRVAQPVVGDELFAVGVIGLGAFTMAVWLGAQLATLVTTGTWLDASPAAGLGAMVRLPSNMGDPAMAWPTDIQSSVPGPVIYWLATSVVLVVLMAAVILMWLWLGSHRVGTGRRDRLGVEVGARLGTARDLKALVVDGPTAGRLIIGRVGKRLVATENPTTPLAAKRWRRRQHGRRSAVAVIGPSQSGKTSNTIAGVLDWDGPAILSSVKDDLFAETVKRRLQLGDVYLFDPMGAIKHVPKGVTRVGWSPLHAARAVSGAIEISMALLDAAPTDGVTNASYFSSKGQALLWPMLFAAAQGGRTMADLVRWLATQDGNPISKEDVEAGKAQVQDKAVGEIRGILNTCALKRDQRVALQAKHALSQFDGFFLLDPRTRSDIYSTAQTLVQPWEDPYISYASSKTVGPVADLRLVLEGNNTLYMSVALKDSSRYAVVYGGLLGMLLRDQAYDVAAHYGQRLPNLLAVIDEAGNTPLRWLPDVASTCSGIGVQLVTVWQSKAQIDAIYQAQAGPMLTNHGTKLIFAGVSDVETLEYVTLLCGEEEVTQRSANADAHAGGYRKGVGDSTTFRPLMPAEVIRQAAAGSALLIHGTLPPAHVEGRLAALDRRLTHLAAGDGPAPAAFEADSKLVAALSVDPTPPVEILEHLSAARPVSNGPLGS